MLAREKIIFFVYRQVSYNAQYFIFWFKYESGPSKVISFS